MRFGAVALAAGLVATTCREEQRKMTPPAAQDLEERLRRDFESRTERPVADRIPVQGSDGRWSTPGGTPITWSGVIGWTRPPQQDGSPFTAYYAAGERRYWVHQGGVLGATEFWLGPFDLKP